MKRSELEFFLAMIEPEVIEQKTSPLGYVVVALTAGGIVGFLLLELVKIGMIVP